MKGRKKGRNRGRGSQGRGQTSFFTSRKEEQASEGGCLRPGTRRGRKPRTPVDKTPRKRRKDEARKFKVILGR